MWCSWECGGREVYVGSNFVHYTVCLLNEECVTQCNCVLDEVFLLIVGQPGSSVAQTSQLCQALMHT